MFGYTIRIRSWSQEFSALRLSDYRSTKVSHNVIPLNNEPLIRIMSPKPEKNGVRPFIGSPEGSCKAIILLYSHFSPFRPRFRVLMASSQWTALPRYRHDHPEGTPILDWVVLRGSNPEPWCLRRMRLTTSFHVELFQCALMSPKPEALPLTVS